MKTLALALLLAAPTLVSAQADEYTRAMGVALREMAGGDPAAGRDRLAGLAQQSPERTAAHCHLAEAHRMVGSLAPALESYRTCARLARQNGQAELEVRGLLGTAQTLTRTEGGMEEAKDAFTALAQFAEAHPNLIAPDLVRARVAAVEAILAADRAAAQVRTRREQRARERESADDE